MTAESMLSLIASAWEAIRKLPEAWQRLCFKLKGWKTILVARLYLLAGALVALHDLALPHLDGLDWAPLIAKLPPWLWPLLVLGTGMLFETLRRITTGPVGHKGEAGSGAEEAA